jgi:hypothetical protein
MKERSSLREPTLILFSIVALCSIYSTSLPIQTMPAIDFYQFWAVGQEVADEKPGNIYSELERSRMGQRYLNYARIADDPALRRTAEHRAVLDTFSTPFLYTVFGSWTSGDYARDLARYRTLGLLVLAVATAVLCRLLGYGAAATIAAVVLFASWFAPSRSDMVVGNVNHFQLGWLVLFLWISARFPTVAGHLAGGFLLGLGAMFKPNTILVIGLLGIAWTVRRRHKKLVLESIGTAAGAVTAFAWSSVTFDGPRIWQHWLSALSALPKNLITVELGNYAPIRLLNDWLKVDATYAIGLLFVGLALAAVVRGLSGALPKGDRDQTGFEDIVVVALAGLVTLLASPLSWLHYFVFTIPMLLVVLRPTSARRGENTTWVLARVAAFIALLTIMMRPLVMLDLGDARGRAILLCMGTALLFGLGVRELLALHQESANAPKKPGPALLD